MQLMQFGENYQQIKSYINRSKFSSTDQKLDQHINKQINRLKVGSKGVLKIQFRCNLDATQMQYR